jgi:hypothetical protein
VGVRQKLVVCTSHQPELLRIMRTSKARISSGATSKSFRLPRLLLATPRLGSVGAKCALITNTGAEHIVNSARSSLCSFSPPHLHACVRWSRVESHMLPSLCSWNFFSPEREKKFQSEFFMENFNVKGGKLLKSLWERSM